MRKVSSRAVNRLRHLDRTAYVPQTLSYRAVYPPDNPKVFGRLILLHSLRLDCIRTTNFESQGGTIRPEPELGKLEPPSNSKFDSQPDRSIVV